MQKCEHGKTITKFCLFQHCQSKQTGGCEDCIKKYHNHIGQISILTEDDIKNIVKKFQIQAHYRPKSRSLQQCIFNYFTHIKTNISLNLDIACKNLINQIGYPYLQKNSALNCYKRLKNKEYRKVAHKQLKQLWELFKITDNNEVVREEKKIYAQAVNKMEETLQKMEKNVKEIFQDMSNIISSTKSNIASYDRSYYSKINDIFKEIKKYPNIGNPKFEEPKQIKKQNFKSEEPSYDRKKLTRDVSLDRHLKVENNLKVSAKSRFQQQINQQQKQKQKKSSNRSQNQGKIGQNLQRYDKRQLQRQVGKKTPRYSIDLKPQQVIIRPPHKIDNTQNQYSQKQEQILERKKKLMQLMNSKPVSKREDRSEKDKTLGLTPGRQKSSRPQLSDYLKNSLTPDRLIIKELTSYEGRPSREQSSFTSNSHSSLRPSITSKRAKTTYQQEQQPLGSKRQTRNETMMSSQTETEELFHAKVHIPIEDNKPQEEFEINEQSGQKCIVVTEVDTLAKEIHNIHNQLNNQVPEQCQSPLLMKKKEIENFSALMKLAQSKILQEEEQESPKYPIQTKLGEKSFVKLHKILGHQQQHASPYEQSVDQSSRNQQQETTPSAQGVKDKLKRQDSVQINDNEQFSLALLLKSLKLTGPQAIPYLQKSLQYSNNNLSAAEYLSYLYLQTEKPQDCLKLCNDILKLISSSETNDLALRLNINKSAALNQLGRYSECITFLERCLRHRHNDQLYKNLADAYYSVGILQKAIYNYEHSIIENSANTEAHYNLAACHYQQENYYNASIYVEKALKHQPTNLVYKEMKKYIDEKILANETR